MKIRFYTALVVLFCLVSKGLIAQFYNLPGEYNFSLLTQKQLAAPDLQLHSAIQPYIHFFSKNYVHVPDSHRIYKYVVNDPGLEALFFKHVIRVEPKNEAFKLRIDPLLNLELGKDINAKVKRSLYTNTRGFIASGTLGTKVYFESMFAENQSQFPDYLSGIVKSSSVVPGQGRYKEFKVTGYDYAFSSGFVSIQALKNLNIQFGHGKQKIGNGYRSLLLSDNSFNYPYARFTQQWFNGRLQYSNIYAVFMNLKPASVKTTGSTEALLQKKAASFQYLSVNLHKAVNIGFFQGMIWQTGNSRNMQTVDSHYFNPVIYTNLMSYQLNNKNNLLAGGDIKIKFTRHLNVYGQWMIDNLSNADTLGKGLGYQCGLNYFNVFGINNLFFQAEYNRVSEGAYRNPPGVISDQSYSHYNQNLAFTPGHGQELILLADYKYKRFFINIKYSYQDVPLNGKTNYLNNIFTSRMGYVINPAYNLNISAGFNYRNQNFYNFRTLNNETSYFFIGLRTSLYNFYYDL